MVNSDPLREKARDGCLICQSSGLELRPPDGEGQPCRECRRVLTALRDVQRETREECARIAEHYQIPGHLVAGPQIAAITKAIRSQEIP